MDPQQGGRVSLRLPVGLLAEQHGLVHGPGSQGRASVARLLPHVEIFSGYTEGQLVKSGYLLQHKILHIVLKFPNV